MDHIEEKYDEAYIPPIEIHDFDRELEYSARYDELFNNFYRKHFKNVGHILPVGIELQRKGIDKIIYFTDASWSYIEEKTRRIDYGDIAIEQWSSDGYKLGWIKTSLADYLAYLIAPTKKIYIFSMKILKAVWEQNEEIWTERYFKIVAYNNGYNTISYAIPISVLNTALNNVKYSELRD